MGDIPAQVVQMGDIPAVPGISDLIEMGSPHCVSFDLTTRKERVDNDKEIKERPAGCEDVSVRHSSRVERRAGEEAKRRLKLADINHLSLEAKKHLLREVHTKVSREEMLLAIPSSVKTSIVTAAPKRRLSQVATRNRGDFLTEIRTTTKEVAKQMQHIERTDTVISEQVQQEFEGIESIREQNQEKSPSSSPTPKRRGSLVFSNKNATERSPGSKSRRSSLFSKKSKNIDKAVTSVWVTQEVVIMQGLLAKKASGMLNNDKWQTRYFAVSRGHLCYYDSLESFKSEPQKPKGVLDLEDLDSCKRLGESTISLTFDQDETEFQAPSYETAMRWLWAIKKSAGICTKPKPKLPASPKSLFQTRRAPGLGAAGAESALLSRRKAKRATSVGVATEIVGASDETLVVVGENPFCKRNYSTGEDSPLNSPRTLSTPRTPTSSTLPLDAPHRRTASCPAAGPEPVLV
jgi:hypothetical protein